MFGVNLATTECALCRGRRGTVELRDLQKTHDEEKELVILYNTNNCKTMPCPELSLLCLSERTYFFDLHKHNTGTHASTLSLLYGSEALRLKWKWSCSVMSDSATPWTVAHQAPLSMGFSRQEYWSGVPFPSPGDLPDPGFEPRSPALQADSLPSELQGHPQFSVNN